MPVRIDPTPEELNHLNSTAIINLLTRVRRNSNAYINCNESLIINELNARNISIPRHRVQPPSIPEPSSDDDNDDPHSDADDNLSSNDTINTTLSVPNISGCDFTNIFPRIDGTWLLKESQTNSDMDEMVSSISAAEKSKNLKDIPTAAKFPKDSKDIPKWIETVRNQHSIYCFVFTGSTANYLRRVWLSGASSPDNDVFQKALTNADVSKGFEEMLSQISRAYGLLSNNTRLLEQKFKELPRPNTGDDLLPHWQLVRSFLSSYIHLTKPCVSHEKVTDYLLEFMSCNFATRLQYMALQNVPFSLFSEGKFVKFMTPVHIGVRPTIEHLALVLDHCLMKEKDTFKEIKCTTKKPLYNGNSSQSTLNLPSSRPPHGGLTLTPREKSETHDKFQKKAWGQRERDELTAKRRVIIENHLIDHNSTGN